MPRGRNLTLCRHKSQCQKALLVPLMHKSLDEMDQLDAGGVWATMKEGCEVVTLSPWRPLMPGVWRYLHQEKGGIQGLTSPELNLHSLVLERKSWCDKNGVRLR